MGNLWTSKSGLKKKALFTPRIQYRVNLSFSLSSQFRFIFVFVVFFFVFFFFFVSFLQIFCFISALFSLPPLLIYITSLWQLLWRHIKLNCVFSSLYTLQRSFIIWCETNTLWKFLLLTGSSGNHKFNLRLRFDQLREFSQNFLQTWYPISKSDFDFKTDFLKFSRCIQDI